MKTIILPRSVTRNSRSRKTTRCHTRKSVSPFSVRSLKAFGKPIGVVLVVIAFLVVLRLRGPVAPAAKTQTCAVSSSQCSFTFNLTTGEKVSGSISFGGASPSVASFWVTDPTGVKIDKGDRISNATSFMFIASKKGAYTLHFDGDPPPSNSGLVTLNYYVLAWIDC